MTTCLILKVPKPRLGATIVRAALMATVSALRMVISVTTNVAARLAKINPPSSKRSERRK